MQVKFVDILRQEADAALAKILASDPERAADKLAVVRLRREIAQAREDFQTVYRQTLEKYTHPASALDRIHIQNVLGGNQLCRSNS